MPLDAQSPGGPVHGVDAFDQAVVGPGRGAEGGCEIADRLVVPGIHRRRSRPQRALEQRTGLDREPVPGPGVGVIEGSGPLARQVLVQRAAERDVEDLDAAADREDRQPALARARDQGELDRVALGIDLAELGVRGGAVARGIDVLAARQHEPGDGREDLHGTAGIERRRDDDGDEPGARQGAHVRGVERDALAPIVAASGGRRGHEAAHRTGGGGGGGGDGAAAPSRGQPGLFTPAQSTRTPYSRIVRSAPARVPTCGYVLGGRCDSYTSTPCARCVESSTTSRPYVVVSLTEPAGKASPA